MRSNKFITVSLILVLTIVLSSAAVFAEEVEEITYSSVVTANPLGVLFGLFNASYEQPLHFSTSYQVGGSFYSYEIGDLKWSGFGVDGSYRMYADQALNGLYYGPVAGLSSSSIEDSFEKESGLSFRVGGVAGRQWIMGDGFAIDLNLGAVYSISNVELDGETVSGFSPTLRLNIGYAW
ncbi:DUF3575 domain-containing protein [Natroniella sp. ANB-PHB2]|uniref:DUF3575 domain-containing protein n=1 Tax=Natroniella sp. ANB-PHB2 TaxID=3384444 RepID=UPI0038D3FA02